MRCKRLRIIYEEVEINGEWYSYNDLNLNDFIENLTYRWTDEQKIKYLQDNAFDGYVEVWDIDEQLKETLLDDIYDGIYDKELADYFSETLDASSRDSYSSLGLSQKDFF